MAREAKHQNPAAKAHRRKFRIDGVQAQQKLATALKALEENEEAILLGLERVTASGGALARFMDMKAALRLLSEGE